MDFFAQQDLARRNTRLLVLMFLAAVLLLVVLTNIAIAAFLFFSQDYNIYSGSTGVQGFLSYFSWERFGIIGLGVSATVLLVVIVKWVQLSTGGKAVAESMGGTLVLPQTRDKAERRALNVVEEIALAANMPVPPLYVLSTERGINAFAAGITPADAVVAVTRGTIDHLKRHELQGVVAHEFSHILNGDMRLNIRLAAMLKGITFIGDVGYFLLRSNNHARSGRVNRDAVGPALPLLGLALLVLGWLGGVSAGFIKAAISRQKEYLADAGAVQFTRSTEGIADALKVIGGYIPGTLVHAARANEMSHIFFGQIEHRLWQMFATHPPLGTRIIRVDPDWNGQYIERKPKHYPNEPIRPGEGEVGVGRATIVAAAAAAGVLLAGEDNDDDIAGDADFAPGPEDLEQQTAEREAIPVAFVRHSHEPLGAQALILSLLIDPDESVRRAQFDIVRRGETLGLDTLINTLYPGVQGLGAPRRLPLLEMCLPALKSMSTRQYHVFKDILMGLIRADEVTHLHEWCLFQLVRHYLDPFFVKVRPSRAQHRKLLQVEKEICTVLSVLAHEGEGDPHDVFRRGADSLGFTNMILAPRQQGDIAEFSRAVQTLADCYPLLKPRLLKAMRLATGHGDELNPVEREIIMSVAAVMDCPLPSL